jgi:hypothetical protein
MIVLINQYYRGQYAKLWKPGTEIEFIRSISGSENDSPGKSIPGTAKKQQIKWRKLP